MLSREILDLNGWWHIWYDEAAPWQSEMPLLPGVPLREVPSRPPTSGWQGMERGLESLQVPGTWALSRPRYRGVAWQWRPIYIPEEWQGRVVRLQFGGVRLRAEVYLDEELVGYDLESSTPFEVDVTDKVRPGRQHELALRITNPGGSTSWPDELPIPWAGRYLATNHDVGGVWGNVSLVATGPDYIASVHALPAPSLASVTLRVGLAHRDIPPGAISREFSLSAQVYDATGQWAGSSVGPVHVRRGDAMVDLIVDLVDPQPWTPDHPYCYRAEVLLSGGGFEDTVPVTFGLRALEARGPHLFLNSEPFFLRGALSQGWYPHNLAFPSVPLAEQEVRAARTLGLNALVMDGSPATPHLLDAADRLGLLIVQDPGGLRAPDVQALPTEQRAFYVELLASRIRRLARRDRNHPSLVWWRLAGPAADLSSLATVPPGVPIPDLAALIHTEDPTRLVSAGSVDGPPVAWNPYSSASFSLYDLGQKASTSPVWRDKMEAEILSLAPSGPDGPMIDSRPTCFAGLADLPALVRRYGDRVLPGSDAEAARHALRALEQDFAAQDMQRTFADVAAFCRTTCEPQEYAVRRTIEAHRLNAACSGLAINHWSSTPMGGNGGLVDIFRRIQVTACNIAQAHAPLTVVLRGLPARVRAQAQCSIQVWALNELGPQHNLTLLWEQRARDGRTVARGGWPLTLAGTERQEYLGQIDLRTDFPAFAAGDLQLLHLELKHGLRALAIVEDHFWISAEAPLWPSGGRILDTSGLLGPLRQTAAAGWALYSSEAPVTPLLLVSWDSGEELEHILRHAHVWPQTEGQPLRLALLLPETSPGRGQVLSTLAGLLPGEPLSLLPLSNERLGGWAYSHAHPLLAGVADPGIWGHPQADLFPSHVVRRLPGNTLVGGCAFAGDQAPLPHLGTALGIIPWGASELLFCVLPVVSGCQKHLLSAEHLMHNIARWLVRKD